MKNISKQPEKIYKTSISKFNHTGFSDKKDFVAVEEPLEIHLEYGETNNRITTNISVTMRTPGDDDQLAVGFLYTEGIFSSITQLAEDPVREAGENQVYVRLRPEFPVNLEKLKRNFYTSSSCGVCGKDSIFAVYQNCPEFPEKDNLLINPEILLDLPHKLRKIQQTFESTGGIHAAALFSAEGDLLVMKEDVGRHNALDKLIGYMLLRDGYLLPLNDKILLLSGRASFELVQKAAMAGIKIVCAVGAPSSLAVETAKSFKITLTGFLKPNSFNIYSQNQRINHENSD